MLSPESLRTALFGTPSRRARLALLFSGVAAACGSVDSRRLGGDPGAASDGGAAAANAGRGGMKTDAGGASGTRASGGASDDHGGQSGDGEGGRAGGGTAGAIDSVEPGCGDAITAGNEECDDGNLQEGDGCNDKCQKEECGNDRIDAGEECDPPSAGECTLHCATVRIDCGDGKLQKKEGEECDDGNEEAGDGCFECRHECGDGRIDASVGEQCEPEYAPDHCSKQCRWLPACGDGDVQSEAGEQCDPSNGVTCVACQLVTPSGCEGGAGGCAGAPSECVPDASSDILQNGGFLNDTSGWLPGNVDVTLSAIDGGAHSPKALEVSFGSGPVRAESGAYQCVPVQGGHRYELRAEYEIPADSPAGVGAAVVGLLYAGTQCVGAYVAPPQTGPQGLVREAWTPYSYPIDTSALPNDGSPARLLLRLDVVRPANVDGSRVLWDSVSLNDPASRCGDCQVDEGEGCDDGNRTPGDGCNPSCQLERCGDGVRSITEGCDDGNTAFGAGDTCTPACRTATACDACSEGQCTTALDACFGLTGNAEAGRGAGIPRSTLCDKLIACVRKTDCDLATRTTIGDAGAFLENCYCGTAGEHCFDGTVPPNGSCRAETEAALETTVPAELLGRFDGSDERYPAFAAVSTLLACQQSDCSSDCARSALCGDGQRQDRNLEFTFVVDRQEVPCDDALTASGHGCSFEECDDGNTDPGDGCDQHCFLEACGNYVTQAGEDCDDGNHVSGDGCSTDCKAEYRCGDEEVTSPFEDCDPPREGAVCTGPQSESNPAECACDDKCRLVVCGDGSVQRPLEDCDPPNGLNCGTDCKALGQSPCEACIGENAVGAYLQSTYCDPDPKCVNAERCIIAAKCFNPAPALCYCGITDVNACSKASFTATGPCVDEIRAGQLGTTNAEILLTYFDFSSSSGAALGILNSVFSNAPECETLCF